VSGTGLVGRLARLVSLCRCELSSCSADFPSLRVSLRSFALSFSFLRTTVTADGDESAMGERGEDRALRVNIDQR